MGIHWHVTNDEAQAVVNIIGQRPYVEVSGLIAKLMQQANESQQRGELRAVDADGGKAETAS